MSRTRAKKKKESDTSSVADEEVIVAMADVGRTFASKVVQPMVGVDGRDGDLDGLPSVVAMAEELGIVGGSGPAAEWAIWRDRCPTLGSVVLLEEIAGGCAGVAVCIHVDGLGARELGPQSETDTLRPAVAFFEDPGTCLEMPNYFGSSARWAATEVELQSKHGVLRGRKTFVFSAPGTDSFVVFARQQGTEQWARVVISGDADGLWRNDLGRRAGLGACVVEDLVFDEVRVKKEQIAVGVDPGGFLARFWLGISAIALGNAMGAHQQARKYATERRQGGCRIERHAAVQLLLGASEARTMVCRAALRETSDSAAVSSRKAAMLKVRIAGDCAQTVTDSLQVFGGYGYMEDYRLEKRLRDALTLKSLGGSPDSLLASIAASGVGPGL